MKHSISLAVLAGFLTIAGCSQPRDAADDTVDTAAAETEANAEAMGDVAADDMYAEAEATEDAAEGIEGDADASEDYFMECPGDPRC